jgi:hypothetical protein
MIQGRRLAAAFIAFVFGCGGGGDDLDGGDRRLWRRAPPLPQPLSSNAVASIELEGGCLVYSALGIDASLSSDGVVKNTYRWLEGDSQWTKLPDVLGDVGRLAAAAVSLRDGVYVLGGYSIDTDGAKTSFGAVHVFDATVGQWTLAAPMPVRVDDHVAVAWRDRWIIAVGGWSNTGPIDAVQIYDADSDSWSAGTSLPGTPVFGHAAALVGDHLVIVDGASAIAGEFELVNRVWLGALDPDDPPSPGRISANIRDRRAFAQPADSPGEARRGFTAAPTGRTTTTASAAPRASPQSRSPPRLPLTSTPSSSRCIRAPSPPPPWTTAGSSAAASACTPSAA